MSGQHAGSDSAAAQPGELSFAEKARTLVSAARVGALSTHSRKFEGFPFGSMMPYASDNLGRPTFFVSSMAMHTQNLQADWRASLMIMQPEADEDPLGAARLTLLGSVEQVAPEEVLNLYLERHPDAREWQDFRDFSFYRLYPDGIYLIAGFGVMGWISSDEYISAAPDPLALFAAGILRHMNSDHPDALLDIARRYVGQEIEEARMTAVDRLGFSIRLRAAETVRRHRIPFPREVRDREQARAALVEMVRSARSE
jgi:hypothetical protein